MNIGIEVIYKSKINSNLFLIPIERQDSYYRVLSVCFGKHDFILGEDRYDSQIISQEFEITNTFNSQQEDSIKRVIKFLDVVKKSIYTDMYD